VRKGEQGTSVVFVKRLEARTNEADEDAENRAVSEQIGLSQAGKLRSIQRCKIPSATSTARPS
jgi:antirestriction protein ArdC